MAKKKAKPAKKHKEKPTSARLLKNRPHDPEPPEIPDNGNEAAESAGEQPEGELLETPDTPKKSGPKQKRLPTMEDAKIEELESLAESYAEIRDDRQQLTTQEVRLKTELLAAMHEHGKSDYVHAGVEIHVIVEKEKVRVRIAKDKDSD
jgi:hypothetical protein